MNDRQAAVDIVLALMQARAGRGRPALPPDPSWEEVTAVASAGLVLPALAAGARALPGGLEALGDAGAFLAAMEASNAARNARLIARLGEAAAALRQAGIAAVALKGAVFALEEPGRAPWRFLGDIDLLIPAERMDDAVAALQPLSYDAQGVADLGGELHHYPPLCHEDGETIVELHSRLFPGAGNALLPPDELLAIAKPAPSAPDVGVLPAAERMVHLIAHAQLANRRFQRRSVSLRDALDFGALMRRGDLDLDAVGERFSAHGEAPAAAGFLVATNRLLAEPFPLSGWAMSGTAWADAAIGSLSDPAGVRRRVAWQWLRDQATLLLRKEGRRRAWTGLRDPERRRRFVQRKLFGWRNIR
jgi:hypothetical protein